MASVGIQSGSFPHRSFLPPNQTNHKLKPNFSVSKKNLIVSASITSSNHGIVSPHPRQVSPDSHADVLGIVPRQVTPDSHGKIDTWMQDSVSDIVKNLKQAPLLVQIYSENGGIEIRTEKAKTWPVVQSQWSSGESKSPDGLIFVEELGQDFDKDLDQDLGEGVTRAWGIVVQRKGVECVPACYLLKTNRVCSGMGLGFCTHFCLMKVNNFRDSALEQFKDSWLLQ